MEELATCGYSHWSLAQRRAAIALVFLGIALRLPLYLANRSLWGDEASLAVNLVGRSFAQLCRPLDYEQAAPLGFLFLQRAVILLLGTSEFALRLVPLLGGVLLLELGRRLTRRYFGGVLGLAALTMLVFSKSLIQYSAELKQYSTDTLIALLIVYFALRLDAAFDEESNNARIPAKPLAWFALLGATVVWFSHPAVFVLAGATAVLAMAAWGRGQFRLALKICAAGAAGGASAFCQFFFFARSLAHDPFLATFWAGGMMPTHPPAATLRWLAHKLPESLQGLFGTTGISLTILFFLAGCAALWLRGRRVMLGLLLAPALTTLAASALRQYPFSDRLVFFLYPLLILILAAGFEGLYRRLPGPWRAVPLLLLAGLLAEPAAYDIKTAFHRPPKEEMRPAVASLLARLEPTDGVYAYFRGGAAFEYYAGRYKLDANRFVLGHGGDAAREELARFQGRRRVWVVCCNADARAERHLLGTLKTLGASSLDQGSAKGVRWGLYDMSDSGNVP